MQKKVFSRKVCVRILFSRNSILQTNMHQKRERKCSAKKSDAEKSVWQKSVRQNIIQQKLYFSDKYAPKNREKVFGKKK